MKLSSLGIAIVCAIVPQFYCASLNYTDGNGSGVGNGKIAGVLYNSDGSRAKNAAIQVIPANYNPVGGLNKSSINSEIKSTTTDDTGGYMLDSLPEQTFNVFGSDNVNKSFIDSVRIDKKTPAILAPDTLRAPGAINGIIRLMPEHDSRSVVIMVIGTTVWTAPEDSIGNFKLQDMAKGRYHVRFLSSQQGYQPLDTLVTIDTGSVNSLPDTLRLIFTGIPVPYGLMTKYDTLKQIVTLWWNKADPALVSGYTLYRRNIDSNTTPAIIYKGSSNDTLYQDSTAVQDMSYEYWVTAFNSKNEEGAKSKSATVKIAGIFSIVDSIVKGSGTQQGQFGYITRIALDSADNMYITDTKNNRLQKFDSAGNFIFMDDSFLMPIGVTISGQNQLLISDFDGRKVVKMDLTGRRTGVFSTIGSPLSALSANDKYYIVSDSGIEIFSSTDSLIQFINLNIGRFNSGDISTDDSGNIIIVLGDKVYSFDKENNSLSMLYQVAEFYSNQNGRVVFLRPDAILVMTNHTNGPIFTTIFTLNHSGDMVAKWNCCENIRDIYPKNHAEVIAVTDNGKILRLNLQKELN